LPAVNRVDRLVEAAHHPRVQPLEILMFTVTRAALAAVLAVGLPMAAQACPDYSLNGAGLNYSSDQAYTPRAHPVTAGGPVNLAGCPQPGVGHVAVAPDFTMQFSGNGMGRALEFRVEGSCDTVLLVNDARANWYFNDDDTSMNPRIRIATAPEGIYDIWIGTYDSNLCSARLIVETF